MKSPTSWDGSLRVLRREGLDGRPGGGTVPPCSHGGLFLRANWQVEGRDAEQDVSGVTRVNERGTEHSQDERAR